MIDQRCDRTDLLASQCAHCLGHHDPVADRIAAETLAGLVEDQPFTATAKSPRSCPDCDGWIYVGALIAMVRVDGRADRWGKRRFRNEVRATRVLHRIWARPRPGRQMESRAYACDRCGGWHLTSRGAP
jgi:hypothetical protein